MKIINFSKFLIIYSLWSNFFAILSKIITWKLFIDNFSKLLYLTKDEFFFITPYCPTLVVGNPLLISRQFMKVKEITHVTLVENPSLHHHIWINTSREFISCKKITNVMLVRDLSLNQDIWIGTRNRAMMDKRIINVILVKNPSLSQEIWRITLWQFMTD